MIADKVRFFRPLRTLIMLATVGVGAAGGCRGKDLPPEPRRIPAGEPELVTIPRADFLVLFGKTDCELHEIEPAGAAGGGDPPPPSEAAQEIAKFIVNSYGADAQVDSGSMDELIKTELAKLTPEQKDKLETILARMIDNLYHDVLEGSVNKADSLLVFYLPDKAERDSYNVRCRGIGDKTSEQRAAAALPAEVNVRIPKAALLAAIEAAKCAGGGAPAETPTDTDAGTAGDVPAEVAAACPTLDPKIYPPANPNSTNPVSGQQGKTITVTLPALAVIAFPTDDATTADKNERDEFLRGLTLDFGPGITVDASTIKLTEAGLEAEVTIADGAATGNRTVVVKSGDNVVSAQNYQFGVTRGTVTHTDAGTTHHPDATHVATADAGQPEAATPPPPPPPPPTDDFCKEHPEACM